MKKKALIISVIFMFVCGLLLWTGCGSQSSEKTDGGEITIGALLPLSGDLADYGQNVQKGINLAVKQINEAGGPLGMKLNVVFRDCQTEPTTLRDGTEKLVHVDKVPAMVGPMIRTDIANEVIAPNKVVAISPSNTPTWVTTLDDDDYMFRTTASDAIQGKVLGQLAWECNYKTAAILYINDPYGGGLAESTKEWFEESGGKVLGMAAYDPGEVTFRMQLNELAKGDPDVLILVAYPESGVVILREALSAELFDQFMFPDGMQSEQMIQDVGGNFLEGMYGTGPGAAENKSYEIYLRDYQAEFGEKPATAYTENSYDAVVAIALAMAAAGNEGMQGEYPGTAIRDNLRVVCNPPGEEIVAGVDGIKKAFELIAQGKEINYDGAAGAIDFDEYGDTITPILIWKIEGGEIVPVRSVLAE